MNKREKINNNSNNKKMKMHGGKLILKYKRENNKVIKVVKKEFKPIDLLSQVE